MWLNLNLNLSITLLSHFLSHHTTPSQGHRLFPSPISPALTGTSVIKQENRPPTAASSVPYYRLIYPILVASDGNVVSSFNHHEAICSSIIPFRRIGGSLFARFYRTCKCSSQQRFHQSFFVALKWIVVSCHKLAFCHNYMKRSSRELIRLSLYDARITSLQSLKTVAFC